MAVAMVAEMTGLTNTEAINLLDAANGDVQMAVTLHFDPDHAQAAVRARASRRNDFLEEDVLHVEFHKNTKKRGNAFAALMGGSDSDGSDSDEGEDNGEDNGGPAEKADEGSRAAAAAAAAAAEARAKGKGKQPADHGDGEEDVDDGECGGDDTDGYYDSDESNHDFDTDSDDGGGGGDGDGEAVPDTAAAAGPGALADGMEQLALDAARSELAESEGAGGPGRDADGAASDAGASVGAETHTEGLVDEDGGGGGDEDEDEDEDEDDWVDDDEPWAPVWNECPFDGHVSKTFEDNLKYMRSAHGFVVPNQAALSDPTGLFAYLQEKVCHFNACLRCNRVFHSLEAVRGHMRDKAHKQADYEKDKGALELARFYGGAAANAALATAPAHAQERAEALHTGTGELVLANGGRVGHRSLRKYYKQSFGKHVRVRGSKSVKQLQDKVALRQQAKANHGILVKSFMLAKGNSKAVASQFVYKQDAADNERRRVRAPVGAALALGHAAPRVRLALVHLSGCGCGCGVCRCAFSAQPPTTPSPPPAAGAVSMSDPCSIWHW